MSLGPQESDGAAAASGRKPARRPDPDRYICPAPECGRPCGHRKALVLHVKWDHLQAPVCCRACRTELNTFAHFLYHDRTCFQGETRRTGAGREETVRGAECHGRSEHIAVEI